MKGKKTNSTLNMAKFRRFIDLAESANRATTRPLFRFLFISEVLGLQIRHGQICWKANTPGYNFYEGTLPGFYHFHVRIPSGIKVANLPCFHQWTSISNFISNPTSSSDTAMPSPYAW